MRTFFIDEQGNGKYCLGISYTNEPGVVDQNEAIINNLSGVELLRLKHLLQNLSLRQMRKRQHHLEVVKG